MRELMKSLFAHGNLKSDNLIKDGSNPSKK